MNALSQAKAAARALTVIWTCSSATCSVVGIFTLGVKGLKLEL